MTVEYLPVGIKCNLKCTYCYQEPMREAGNFSVPLNWVKVKDSITKAASGFALFGGEPLLTPFNHLEEIFAFGDSIKNNNGIQTNGLLILPEHVKLFKKHNVHVGVSIDGPGLCNTARCTDFDTMLIINNIKAMLGEGIPVSLILTVHALNYLHADEFFEFITDMYQSGVTSFNFHNLEVDNDETRAALRLGDERNLEIFKGLYEFTKKFNGHINPFNDIKKLLTEREPSVSCIWSGCDPLTTPAVHGINAEGSLTNCGRTNKDGIDWLKSDSPRSLERYQALSLTSQDHGGCQNCDYFFVCKGNCPGTAIDGDWRNRTVDCKFWYGLIDYIRKDLVLHRYSNVLDIHSANSQFLHYINRDRTQQTVTLHTDIKHADLHSDHSDYHSDYPKFTNRIRESELGLREVKG